MKKLTVFLSVMLLGIMVSTFTSCLSDDDDDYKTYSQEEMRAFMRQIDGSYTGKLYFYNDLSYEQGRLRCSQRAHHRFRLYHHPERRLSARVLQVLP